MTRKTATLPRPPARERWAAPANRPRPAFARDDALGRATQPDKPARILIVEDDFLVAADVEAALLDEGFEIVGVAESADSAIRLAAAQKPSLILMDIRLAGARDGIDAAIEIFRSQGIRCLFASAHSDLHARTRSESARPLGWLQKPYTMSQLLSAVKQALSDLSDVR